MNKVVINGQFLARKLTGQERFAIEIVKEIDKLIEKNSIELVIPKSVDMVFELNNIKVIRYGNVRGKLWEQISLAKYLIKEKAVICINLCSIMPIVKPGIICIHDISYKVNPEYFKTLYGIISKYWHRLNYVIAWKMSPLIYTVSDYSKHQIMDVYGVPGEKIHIISSGWQHFDRVVEDKKIAEKYPVIKQKEYYFSLGTIAPNKNIQWILSNAKRNLNNYYLIAGNTGLSSFGIKYETDKLKNVIFTGYLDDGEIKYLMRNCKAFLFPSFFEGFGLPPLEALSVGCKIVVSNTTCLPEIYGKAAYYIDPDNPEVDLNELLKEKVENADGVLQKYSYEKSARIIIKDLINMHYI